MLGNVVHLETRSNQTTVKDDGIILKEDVETEIVEYLVINEFHSDDQETENDESNLKSELNKAKDEMTLLREQILNLQNMLVDKGHQMENIMAKVQEIDSKIETKSKNSTIIDEELDDMEYEEEYLDTEDLPEIEEDDHGEVDSADSLAKHGGKSSAFQYPNLVLGVRKSWDLKA